MTRPSTPSTRRSLSDAGSLKYPSLSAEKSAAAKGASPESPGRRAGKDKNKLGAERSLYLFARDSNLRKAVTKVATSKCFDNFILLVILVNCILLALDKKSPSFPDSETYDVIDKAEYVFIVIFTIEMLIKTLAFGFVFGEGTYLKDYWNCLDFTVVLLA